MSSLSATSREVTKWTGLCVSCRRGVLKLFVEMVCQGGVSWLVGAAVGWDFLFVRRVFVCPVGLSSA